MRVRTSRRWCNRRKRYFSTCSAKRSNRRARTAPASGPTPNIYNELGIPAIKIGPRGRRISARNEEIDVEEMVKAAQIYALMALDICNRERPR